MSTSKEGRYLQQWIGLALTGSSSCGHKWLAWVFTQLQSRSSRHDLVLFRIKLK